MRHDAIVIGGGPAGATAAVVLARAGWSVALIERTPFPRRKVCGEFLSATNLPLLRELGIADQFLDLGGPEIRRVGVFAGQDAVTAEMPRYRDDHNGWGRALGREHLDTLLLERARAAGASVWQPADVIGVSGAPGDFFCTLSTSSPSDGAGRRTTQLHAPIVIAAHGSWDTGALPSHVHRTAARNSDLFGFKARFVGSRLQRGLMPLLSFPGGYGGMVRTDHDYVSLSCCIRRDALARCRRELPGASAGDAVLAHIIRTTAAVRDALDGAELETASWRSAGPIIPGIRNTSRGGVLLIGNAAGEAHPVVAEGISMAIQSASLLARLLIGRAGPSTFVDADSVETAYARAWRRAFAPRIRAAAIIAQWAMRPRAVTLTMPLLRAFPMMLTESARKTGKVTSVVSSF
jgi:menaquinone-9 beta-reductase